MPDTKQFHPRFPLSDVNVQQVEVVKEINDPDVSTDWLQMTKNEFRMIAPEVGTFYASHGETILFSPVNEATDESVELYMNGSVFGAILYQRGILPIHGSSFVYNGSGVMLCGHSGAGKSSLTSAVCLSGQGTFLTDDVTPILFNDGEPTVLPKSDRVKLWEDSLIQLSEEKDKLKQIRPQDNKFYLNIDKPATEPYPLHQVVIINVSEEVTEPKVEKMSGAEAFSVLQKEIYRLFYLQAMPQQKARYFMQLSAICNQCSVQRLTRPAGIPIKEMAAFLTKEVLTNT
jgi:hypothetical protein